ncbi:hypothetical protein [Streptomyces spectabilis]|uniref:Uncharacterized protein n=1 Tax=Streptomyces spectabilis TaxID=68270 RepID=A0A7W8EXU5_STRST|nr:hypothetical protein [Streptomyces spectabilis]MBB5109437.1 hypothetical protein [Streptomyces spectabilis]MCI3907787.1 hypothetical protein [Streptomyces spectabilis]
MSHHQYVLFDTDAEAPFERIDDLRAGNGLVSINSEGTYASVLTGTPYGALEVSFDTCPGEPELDCTGWDEVVEVSLCLPGHGPLVGDPVSDDTTLVPLLPGHGPAPIEATDSGEDLDDEEDEGRDDAQWWRFRFHARGRDTTADPHSPPERHFVQIWPAPRAGEIRHKLTDQTGHRTRNPDPEYYAQAKAAEAAADAASLPDGAAHAIRPVMPRSARLEEERGGA